MTTFTTEDREWAYWNTYNCPKYNQQTEIKFFFPLTEQVPLGLSFEGCDTRKKVATMFGSGTSGPMWGSITTSTGINASTLTVESKNSVGELNIGPIQIGMEQSPKWYQKVLYRLLGFKWKKR